MTANTVLIIIGAVLVVVGLAKAGRSGGFGLSNFGINFGGETTQTNKIDNVTGGAAAGTKPDWVGLAIAAIGLVTAGIGLLK
jgi:hypothetical protein